MSNASSSFSAATALPSRQEVEAFLKSADRGRRKTISALLDTYGDNIVNVKDTFGTTALLAAAWRKHADVVTLLLEHGAKVELQDGDGDNALILASWSGCAESVRQLLKYGANIEAKNHAGSTALIWAAREGHNDIVTLLLERGAHIAEKNNVGTTALSAAAHDRHADTENILRQGQAHRVQALVEEMTQGGIHQEFKAPPRLALRSPIQRGNA